MVGAVTTCFCLMGTHLFQTYSFIKLTMWIQCSLKIQYTLKLHCILALHSYDHIYNMLYLHNPIVQLILSLVTLVLPWKCLKLQWNCSAMFCIVISSVTYMVECIEYRQSVSYSESVKIFDCPSQMMSGVSITMLCMQLCGEEREREFVTTIVYPGHLRSWSMRQIFRIGPRIDSHKGKFF